MNYQNSELRIDQIISYFNEDKINLSPPFQRGRVWNLTTRQKLIRNMVQGKPIPAIFLYKEPSGVKIFIQHHGWETALGKPYFVRWEPA